MTWSDITNGTVSYIVYNGKVLNLSPLLALPQEKRLSYFGQDVLDLAIPNIGRDVTLQFAAAGLQREAECLVELFRFATVDFSSDGCLGAQVVLITSFAIIGVVVAARFFLALYFSYAIGWRLGNSKAYAKAMEDLRRRRAEQSEARRRPDGSGMANVVDIPLDAVARGGAKARQGDPRFSVNPRASVIKDPSNRADNWSYNFGFMDMEAPQVDAETEKLLNDPTLMHTLVMVPCYSEGYESLEATLTSVARSYYPSTHKCLFVIADGIVKGSENSRTTPEILIDMIEVDERFRKDDPRWGGEPEAFSYVAIADGNKRKNYARVYAGWYRYDPATDEASKKKKDRASAAPEETREEGGAQMRTLRERKEGRVPMLLIVKVGNEEERESGKEKKPGNRGKRDSQVILMNFLSKVMFDDRMTELEFDIFFKLFTITGINPERYEGVLMVDADTRIYPDSLTHMVACLLRDHRVMGLCGETKILNKWESWVTMIQVFEYFVSHHLAKAFESVFGGVTCLPGCFSMYRVKTPKGPNGYWVPILANPDIVEEYSENIVDTLHKKNLLLLGEDRFLSTMMLRNFPKRRMVFVPPAICKTVVPNTFKVLLSQRRRWINSTIHNLMELVLVKDLCAGILGLPAVLILLTANKVIYVFWMIIYLFSLPIWNFVLPLYAFWHFDDFSWGETRKVIGEVKGHDHSTADGEFDSTGISMKRWREWVKVRKDEANASEMERSRGYSRFPEQNGRMSMSSSTLQGSSQSLNFGRIPQYLVNTPSFSAVGSTIPIMPPGVQPPPNLVAPPPGMMPPQVGMYGRPPANYLMYPQFNMSSPGPSARHVNPYHTDSENDFVPGGSTLPGADK
ncbi:Chitin synthase, class 3 [Irineochytrium annulatum]|nr:Chitin synthase, class 3 [Irineochytrium annulatum]